MHVNVASTLWFSDLTASVVLKMASLDQHRNGNVEDAIKLFTVGRETKTKKRPRNQFACEAILGNYQRVNRCCWLFQ